MIVFYHTGVVHSPHTAPGSHRCCLGCCKLFKVTLTDNPRDSFVVMVFLMGRVDMSKEGVS